jgi:hypothetical protein
MGKSNTIQNDQQSKSGCSKILTLIKNITRWIPHLKKLAPNASNVQILDNLQSQLLF